MNKNTTTVSKLNNLIAGLVAIMAFVIPSFFLTITNEYFEFNKTYLFITLTIIMLLLWGTKMVVEKKFYFTRSFLDIPLIIALFASLMSALASLDKNSSMFGSYGRWFPSLFVLVAMYLFYYTATTNINSAKKIRIVIYALTAGTLLPSVLGVINYYGLTIPFANLLNQKGFLLSGTTVSLATMSFIGLVVGTLTIPSVKSNLKKLFFSTVALANFLSVMVFGGPIYLVLATLIISVAYSKTPADLINKSRMYLFPLAGFAISLSALFFLVPQTKDILHKDYPMEPLPSTRESWIVASTTLRDFPIFGSGLSTFYLNYPRYRTISQNATKTWNIIFDKPANEIFDVISTMGIFGLVAYGILLVFIARFVIKTIKVNDAYKGLTTIIAGGVVAGLLSMLIAYSSFQSAFFVLLLLSLLVAEAAINNNKSWAKPATLSLETKSHVEEGMSMVDMQIIQKREVFPYIMALPILAVAVFGAYQTYLQYVPELYLKKSVSAASNQNVNASYDYQVRAIDINPNRSYYHRVYINTNVALAQALSSKENMTDQEKAAVQNLLAQALRNAKFVTETLNPLDVTNWTVRAQLYRFLMPIAKDADQFAIQAYNTAIQLYPTNPTLRVELGGIYYSKEDYLSAGNLFKQAVNLKPDYANARYNLAHALIKLKAFSDAKTELELVQSLVQKDSEDYKLATADLELVNKELASITGAQAENRPSVQTLEQAGQNQTENAPQEPLTKPESEPNTGIDLERDLRQNP